MVSILFNRLPPSIPRDIAASSPPWDPLISGTLGIVEGSGSLPSNGGVGVALLDLEVGKGGKAQSWETVISVEGGRAGRGVVALRGGS